MNKLIYSVGIWLFALLLALPSHAQYVATPPIQDGNISYAEYNNNVFAATNSNGTSGGTWFMTWDATNLYVAKTGGQAYEPTLMYLDLDPILPVTGGGAVNGNLNGFVDQTGRSDQGVIPVLPFRADVRVRVVIENNVRSISISRRDGNGGWGTETQAGLSYGTNGTDREFSMSWNALTGGGTIPPSFNWLGYATNTRYSNDNYRYDQAPSNYKAFGSEGTTAPLTEYYFTVVSTANGSATKPFSLTSYTFLGVYAGNNTVSTTDNSFGAISVWDYTMNLAGGQISRGTTGGDWTISGSLVVGNGILYFGSGGTNFGSTNVGNVRVLGNGVLDMNQTNKPLTVREDVDLTGGSQFILSGAPNGDLSVGRHFYVRDGVTTTQATFQPGLRAVSFFGTGVTHNIQANSTTYQVPFSYLDLNSQSGSIALASSIFVSKQVRFSQGLLITGNNFVQLDGGVDGLINESAASHIVGNTRITQTLGTAQSGTRYFGNVGFVLTPQNSTTALGDVTITRVTGTALTGVGVGNNTNSILRYFVVTTTNTNATGLDLQLQFTYRTDEQNNITTSNQALYQSSTGAPGTFLRLTSPGTFTGTTLSYNYTGTLTSGSYFTVGDGVVPLPVTLVSFTATPTAQGAALLHWVTASEANSKGFAIERQLSSGAWQQVGYVTAANAATGSTYDFTDKSLAVAPATALAYYRLRQEDFDGTTSYSPVATVARPALVASTELLLSPVPVTGANLSMTFAEAGQAGLEIAVVNTQGQSLLHFTTEASAETALSLPVEKLAAGVYIVSVRVPGQPVRHARFVKL